MIKYILTIFLFVSALSIYSQDLQLIKFNELATIDSTILIKEIKRISSSENKRFRGVDSLIDINDVDTMCILHFLKIQYDSLNNEISFSEEKDKYYIFFTNHDYLYKFSNKKKLSALPLWYTQENLLVLSSIAQRDFEYVCYVPTLTPNEKNIGLKIIS